MTHDQWNDYLNRVYPKLLLTISLERQDFYQIGIITLSERYERYECETDKDFMNLLHAMALSAEGNEQTKVNRRNSIVRIDNFTDLRGKDDDEYDAPDPLDESDDLRSQAVEYIALLPSVYRRIFVQVYIEGKSEREVAQEQGVSPARISQLIKNGIKLIREALKQ